MTSPAQFDVEWIDVLRSPKCPPNPAYPDGIDLDISSGQSVACTLELPYPAKRCGFYAIECRGCGKQIAVTTAGRPDDPRSVRIACQYPVAKVSRN